MRIAIHDRDPSGRKVPGASWFRGAESMVAGAGAGLVTSVVTCPLDVIKTRLQAGGANAVGPKGMVGTFQHIYHHDGFRGLYRGLGPTIIGYLPTWAIYFTVYDSAKSHFESIRGPDDAVAHILAAMTAGASGTILTNPLWVVKTRFMTQSRAPSRLSSSSSASSPASSASASSSAPPPPHSSTSSNPSSASTRTTPTSPQYEKPYSSTWNALVRIYQAEGMIAFYRGLLPSLFGVVHVAVQFPLYEKFKALSRPSDGSPIPSSTILLASSLSKMIASIATYPHEVLRTRLQIQKAHRASSSPSPSSSSSSPSSPAAKPPPFEGLSAVFRRILAEEGVKGLYRGMGTNLVRTVPSSAVTILAYETLFARLREWTHPELTRD